jgi:hypothetical protein
MEPQQIKLASVFLQRSTQIGLILAELAGAADVKQN